jgi:hypothetical protein
VIDTSLGTAGQAGGALQIVKKLNDGLRLLQLDASPVKDGTDNAESPPGLWDVEKRLFKDNESARTALVELEVDGLSEAEARSVLERRVEIGK